MSHPPVCAVDHPLVALHLSQLRDKATPPPEFRLLVRRLAMLLAYEATRDLATAPVTIETPLTSTEGKKLGETIGIVPILRAGLAMVDPLIDLIPDAQVWHLGLYRDEETAQPVEYYSKLPDRRPVDVAMVVDPMLATGGSAVAALDTLKRWGVKRTMLLSIIASQPGVDRLREEHPETRLFVCCIDPELNDQQYIVPGLGDAGDRVFNTLVS
ncbi:Uracil phosphoribosyltransferase [Pirellulimonas nuda]|uniref:Uracil phosphoribosyltransferase n=1 Tax=Pirellulimonas nuda TaxID=2528009 RepID=A0A518DEN5_9BACT|nr:uracil phosphoribosyltransferase [Pirellulimonas nuda]QDU89945.1 Uracil phosphoribosyltransferase [Pirellulimonas nuda]